MNDVFVKLDIYPDVKPVANKQRRILFHLREKVKLEVNHLMSTELVTEPSGWVCQYFLNTEDAEFKTRYSSFFFDV